MWGSFFAQAPNQPPPMRGIYVGYSTLPVLGPVLCLLIQMCGGSNCFHWWHFSLNKEKRECISLKIVIPMFCHPSHPFSTPQTPCPRKGGVLKEEGLCIWRETAPMPLPPSDLKQLCPCTMGKWPLSIQEEGAGPAPTLDRYPLWGTYIPHIPCRTDGKPSCKRMREKKVC